MALNLKKSNLYLKMFVLYLDIDFNTVKNISTRNQETAVLPLMILAVKLRIEIY